MTESLTTANSLFKPRESTLPVQTVLALFFIFLSMNSSLAYEIHVSSSQSSQWYLITMSPAEKGFNLTETVLNLTVNGRVVNGSSPPPIRAVTESPSQFLLGSSVIGPFYGPFYAKFNGTAVPEYSVRGPFGYANFSLFFPSVVMYANFSVLQSNVTVIPKEIDLPNMSTGSLTERNTTVEIGNFRHTIEGFFREGGTLNLTSVNGKVYLVAFSKSSFTIFIPGDLVAQGLGPINQIIVDGKIYYVTENYTSFRYLNSSSPFMGQPIGDGAVIGFPQGGNVTFSFSNFSGVEVLSSSEGTLTPPVVHLPTYLILTGVVVVILVLITVYLFVRGRRTPRE